MCMKQYMLHAIMVSRSEHTCSLLPENVSTILISFVQNQNRCAGVKIRRGQTGRQLRVVFRVGTIRKWRRRRGRKDSG